MAVIGAAVLLHRGRGGGIDDKQNTEYDEVYLVQTDGPTAIVFIANAPGIPPQFAPYATDPNAILLTRSPRGTNDESAQTWEVTCHYSSKYDFQYEQNPLDRPPRFSRSIATFTKPFDKDIVTGAPVLNLARQRYDPPAELNDSRVVIKAVRNEAQLPGTRDCPLREHDQLRPVERLPAAHDVLFWRQQWRDSIREWAAIL